MAPIKVVLVAEKPSLAASIAEILSHGQMSTHRRGLDIHEFHGSFRGEPAMFKMTSVIGHVFALDFLPQFQSWEGTDPQKLFFAGTRKSEANPKARVKQHLQDCAKGCQHIVLWLDCDREGENICFEVLQCCLPVMNKVSSGQCVWRAKFSAISARQITSAMKNLGEPNENEANAVDARQELDLKVVTCMHALRDTPENGWIHKHFGQGSCECQQGQQVQVGVAFTRFQTRYFQGKYGNLDATVISYGPCQTPTLNFTVEQHQRIVGFQPERYWVVSPECYRDSGQRFPVEWSRGRLFQQDVARAVQLMVQDAGSLKCVSYKEEGARKHRPHGLNTVELLKVASASLGIGPHQTMAVAERLYIQGFISYPRTESTKYPEGFNFDELLVAQANHPFWGHYVQELMNSGVSRPMGGIDMGDHPPITPVAMATESSVGGGDDWRIYEYVARHFLGTVSADCAYLRSRAGFAAAGEEFTATGVTMSKPGFTAIMPWAAPSSQRLPDIALGETLVLRAVHLQEGETKPPDYLTESELIGLMEKHGIGTDASISVHINNICQRNYVAIHSGRRVVPTELGITLISGYQRIDPELCRPQVRAHVERQILLVAEGKANKEDVVQHTLQQFLQKFLFFVQHIDRMDSLFEASFSPLTASGKPLSLCGKCQRYMKYISARPCRLYCPTCEQIYGLPQGGDIKVLSGSICPLDKFEILQFSMGGKDGKKYSLCPFCYSNPPFEDITNKKQDKDASSVGVASTNSGMPCNLCAHPTCKWSVAQQSVMACPECGLGTITLGINSAPKWRMDCNKCNYLVYLPQQLQAAAVLSHTCEDCESKLLRLTWKKGSAPSEVPAAESGVDVCLICEDAVAGLCEFKHGHARAFHKGRGRRRGRGCGKGRKRVDPKMSFSAF